MPWIRPISAGRERAFGGFEVVEVAEEMNGDVEGDHEGERHEKRNREDARDVSVEDRHGWFTLRMKRTATMRQDQVRRLQHGPGGSRPPLRDRPRDGDERQVAARA